MGLFSSRGAAVLVTAVLTGCAGPIKGYDGDAIPESQTANIRAVVVGGGSIRAQLLHPATGEPIRHKGVFSYEDRSPWMAIAASDACYAVRSTYLQCPGLVDSFSVHNPGCRAVGLWEKQAFCFSAVAGGTYEIEIRTRPTNCWTQQHEIAEFALVDAVTGETLQDYPVPRNCQPLED